jgi:hypothetical protein
VSSNPWLAGLGIASLIVLVFLLAKSGGGGG